MKNNTHKKYLFLSFIFMIFFIFVFLFLYREINDEYNIAQKMNMDLEAEIEKQNEVKILNDSFKTISEEKTLFDSHFAKSSDIVFFLDTIEQLAFKSSAKAEFFSVEQPINKEKEKEDKEEILNNLLTDKESLILGIKVSGSFEEIYKFITLLENAPYELEIISFDISREGGDVEEKNNNSLPKWSGILKVQLISFIP